MKSTFWIGLALLLVGFSTPTIAQAPSQLLNANRLAWFYNRVGARTDDVASDQSACVRYSRVLWGYADTADANPGHSSLGLLIDVLASGDMAAAMDECMISMGYRRFDIAGQTLRDFSQRYSTLSPETQALYAGADTPPEGVLSATWVDVTWLPTPNEVGPILPPRHFMPFTADFDTQRDWNSRWTRIGPTRNPATAPSVDGSARVVLTLGTASGEHTSIQFERSNFETGEPDYAPGTLRMRWPTFQANGAQRQTYVFDVPPGAYALSEIWAGGVRARVCLGTVVFRVDAGTTTDLGDFTAASERQQLSPLAYPPPYTRLRIDQPASEPSRVRELGLAATTHLTRALYLNQFRIHCNAMRKVGFDLPSAAAWNGARIAG